jgi:hypothetical protein
LSFTGAQWNDGGSLAGFFTVSYTNSGGNPTGLTLVSADVTTGNGTNGDGFAGQIYCFNDAGCTSSVVSNSFDALQANGAPANELEMSLSSGYGIFLDWQGENPTSLYVGNGGQFTSENTPGFSVVRSISTSGGSPGSPGSASPEPATIMLTGLALAATGWVRRRKSVPRPTRGQISG